MAGGSSVLPVPTAADVLVAKCSRAELEKLILTSIRSQEAVALADVEAAIEAAAAALQPKAPVLDDVSMQGAGLLDVRRSDETD
jgi:ABC-type transporter Mla subunit MlaD